MWTNLIYVGHLDRCLENNMLMPIFISSGNKADEFNHRIQ